jgi:hypothetical protein
MKPPATQKIVGTCEEAGSDQSGKTKWATGFLFWYKKTVMPKQKVFAARNLRDYLPNLPLEPGKAQKKISLLSRLF